MRVGILTVSDTGSRGERNDSSGDAISELLADSGDIVERHIVPDERSQIEATLAAWADSCRFDIVITTGGTGLAARDVTPEATLAVADRVVPGIAEAMRVEGLRHTRRAMLSRGVAVVRAKTMIVNLPGSERAVRESLSAILPELPHAADLLRGHTQHVDSQVE